MHNLGPVPKTVKTRGAGVQVPTGNVYLYQFYASLIIVTLLLYSYVFSVGVLNAEQKRNRCKIVNRLSTYKVVYRS